MAGMAPESWNKPWPLGVLLFGLIMLLLAVIGTFTGKLYGKGGTADHPRTFHLLDDARRSISVCRVFDLVLAL
jgi:hypothetical protein